MQALNKLSQQRSTLSIDYKLSNIVDADCVLVLYQGQIVAKGAHVELLQNLV